MSRKKTVKRTVKGQADNTVSSAIQKIEKDFSAAPALLSAQIVKEINSLTQQESKLKKTLGKLSAQVKSEAARVKTASKKATTATGKKQLAAAKKSQAEVNKLFAAASKELQTIASTLSSLSRKQTRVSALRKHIAQFEKLWAKKATLKNKVARRKKAAKSTLTVVSNEEPVSTVIEDISARQITELAS